MWFPELFWVKHFQKVSEQTWKNKPDSELLSFDITIERRSYSNMRISSTAVHRKTIVFYLPSFTKPLLLTICDISHKSKNCDEELVLITY